MRSYVEPARLDPASDASAARSSARVADAAVAKVARDPAKRHAFGRQTFDALSQNTLALVLAGGRGARLEPLTRWRPKPALPFGGKFRIIDFTLSNCVNSGVRRICIFTQYKAQSLIRHVQRGWSFLDGRFDEFVEIMPAQQRIEASWYRGTADAVYQNLDILRLHALDHVMVLAADHVYKMDYRRMLHEHVATGAVMTIACVEVPCRQARAFGVVQVDEANRIVAFTEKPADPAPIPGRPDRALVSMGVYVIDASSLYDELLRDADQAGSTHDFGKDLIPHLVARGARVVAHDFARSCVSMPDGIPYWRDVGTVDAYWEANLALTDVVPVLDLYDEDWPIWTYQEQLPPAKFVFNDDGRRGMAVDSLVAGGCIVSGASVERSVLFSNVRVEDYAAVRDCVILPTVEIGRGAVVRRAVIDKYCKVPAGLTIGVDGEADRRRFAVTPGGITVVIPEMLGQQIHHLR